MMSFSKLKSELKRDHSLAEYTSWKIGGRAEYFYRPVDLEDLVELLANVGETPITILGAASNVLIRDSGISGLVVYLHDSLNKIQELEKGNLHVEAGVKLMSLVQKCAELGVVSAAFLAGIPGTVGGALKMNAGAFGDSIWNYVEALETINRLGEIKTRPVEEFNASYRQVDGLEQDEWFLSAQLSFPRDDVKVAKEEIQKHLRKRSSSQPLNLPNCGSVFRNPQKDYAARLIEASGLKGRQIGGAKVSEKHANFIVNCGGAASSDVEKLIQEIIATVEKSSGVKLAPEVEILG